MTLQKNLLPFTRLPYTQRLLPSILQEAGIGIMVVSQECTIIYANELGRKCIGKFLHKKELQVHINNVIATGKQYTCSSLLPSAVLQIYPVQPDHRHTYAGIITVRKSIGNTSVSPHKEPVAEIKFNTLLKHSTDGIQLIDSNRNVIYISTSGEKIMGYSRNEILQRDFISFVHMQYREKVCGAFENLLSMPNETIAIEYKIKHGKNKWIDVKGTYTNYLLSSEIHAVVVNFKDISRQKKLERLNQDFIYAASHELKTPVTGVKTYSQILEKRFTENGDISAAQLVGRMNLQIDRLIHLMNTLLDVTKIESGKMKLTEEYFSFTDLLKETVCKVQNLPINHKIANTGTSDKFVYGDKTRIEQVIMILIANAIKYSPEADDIVMEVTSDKKNIILSIKDFGLGIPMGKRKQLFKLFSRIEGKKEETFPGLGLGLFIAYEIIKRHKGKIWFTSAKGKGTTFSFSLPARS